MRVIAPCPVCQTPAAAGARILLAQATRHGGRRKTWICRACTAARTRGPEPTLLAQYRTRVFGDHEHVELLEADDGSAVEADAARERSALRRRIDEVRFAAARTKAGEHARVLHVGARDGSLLAALPASHAVREGIEPWSPWIEQAERKGISCRAIPIEETDPSERWDVIVEHHVLEHMHRPIAHLEAIAARLAPDGVAVIEVPNLLAAYGQLEDRFLQDGHPIAYTPRALLTACKRAGLIPIRFDLEPALRVFCRRGTPDLRIEPGPSAQAVLEAVAANDLRLHVKQGLHRVGPVPRMLGIAARAHASCRTASGRADIALEIADACSRAAHWVDVVYWLRTSLADRSDPEVERALAKAELVRGRSRQAWHACQRSTEVPHPDQERIFRELEKKARALPC